MISIILVSLLLIAFFPAANAAESYLNGREYCSKFPGFMALESGRWISIPESYSQPEKGTIEIYAWLSPDFDPALPTVLIFTGGPGQNSHMFADPRANIFKALRLNALYFDQRGISCSRPAKESSYRDPQFYSSEATARDAEEIRKAFGLSNVHVWGGSYGTVPATIFAHLFPNSTSSLMLEGAIYEPAYGMYKKTASTLRIIQKEFDSLSESARKRVIDLTERGILNRSWFTKGIFQTIIQSGLYDLHVTRQAIEEGILAADEEVEENIRSLIHRYLGEKYSNFIPDTLSFPPNGEAELLDEFDRHVNTVLNCKEYGFTDPKAYHQQFLLLNGKVHHDPEVYYAGTRCESAGVTTAAAKPYHASNYPVSVSTTYLHGTVDLATPTIGTVTHYKRIPTHGAQLVLVKGGGHVPGPWLQSILDLTKKPQQACFTAMYRALLIGQPMPKTSVDACSSAGEFKFVTSSR